MEAKFILTIDKLNEILNDYFTEKLNLNLGETQSNTVIKSGYNDIMDIQCVFSITD